jgi:GNAT superfamily N-acetyltransferase
VKTKIIETEFGYCDWDLISEEIFDEDGEVVGENEYVLIENLFVVSSQRGKGYATDLLNLAISTITKQTSLPIKIVAEPKENSVCQNRLIEFYSNFPVEVVAF